MNMEEIYGIRLDRLKRLLWETPFEGKQSAFAAAVGKPANYISRVLSGNKKLGEEIVRDFEDSLSKPAYWFDGRDRRDTWPFQDLPAERVAKLSSQQIRQLETAMLTALSFIEGDNSDKSRSAAA